MKFKNMFMASAIVLGSTISASADTQETPHACSNIETTTHITDCLEQAVDLPNLIAYLEMVENNAAMSEVYQQIDVSNEACEYLKYNSAELTRANQIAQMYPNEPISDVEPFYQAVKSYFENAAICYSDALDLYEQAGIEENFDSLIAVRDAAQNAADAITLD